MDELNKVYQRSPNVVARQVADECILVPIRHNAADLDSIYTLNEVGRRIWDLIDGEKSAAEIGDVISAEFEAGDEEVRSDLQEFLAALAETGGIVEARDGVPASA